MYPCLREGDIVLLSPFEDAEIKPGVVVLFAYGESHLLHRVIFRKDDKLIIQGDNVFSHVEKVKMNNVIAVMKQYSKKNGKVISSDSCVWKLCLFRNRVRKQIKKIIFTIKNI
jgi:signal peptidase I